MVAEVVDGPEPCVVPSLFVDVSFDLSVVLSVELLLSAVFGLGVDFFVIFFDAVQALASPLLADVFDVPLSDFADDSGIPSATQAAKLALSFAATDSFGGMVSSSRLFSANFAAMRAFL